MFLGHFGLAFAAKKIDTKPSLGTYFLAAQFIDLIWPFFLLAGIEKVSIDPGNTVVTPLSFDSYPYSHSFLSVLIWAVLFALVYFLFHRDRKSALVLSVLVVSHWLLDLLVHRPDLPLGFAEETKLGLGIWNNKVLTFVLELGLFALGVWLYLRITKAKNKTGSIALWALVIFFVLIYLANVFGDPPPSAQAIGYVGLAQWLFVFWGYWVDVNRTALMGTVT